MTTLGNECGNTECKDNYGNVCRGGYQFCGRHLPVPRDYKDVGHQSHYEDDVIEPMQILYRCMSPEGFMGFLLGSAVKYNQRQGKKTDGDLEKRDQYLDWLHEYCTTGRLKQFDE